MEGSPETVRHIDHAQREIRRMRDPSGGEVHEVFQAPVLFGLQEVQLDLAPQAVIVHELCGGQCQVTAAQEDMGLGLGAQVGLGEEDDMPRLYALLVEQWGLGQAGLGMPLPSGLLQGLVRYGVSLHLLAILAPGAPAGLGACLREVQRRIVAQLGNQVQVVRRASETRAGPGHSRGTG